MQYELIRLGALLTAAEHNPLSCPRDRNILLAKIRDLEIERDRIERNMNRLRMKAEELEALIALETERERVERNVSRLWGKIAALALAAEETQNTRVRAAKNAEVTKAQSEAQNYSESCDLRLWEMEQL